MRTFTLDETAEMLGVTTGEVLMNAERGRLALVPFGAGFISWQPVEQIT